MPAASERSSNSGLYTRCCRHDIWYICFIPPEKSLRNQTFGCRMIIAATCSLKCHPKDFRIVCNIIFCTVDSGSRFIRCCSVSWFPFHPSMRYFIVLLGTFLAISLPVFQRMNTQQKGKRAVFIAHQAKRTPKFKPMRLCVSNGIVRLPLTMWCTGQA